MERIPRQQQREEQGGGSNKSKAAPSTKLEKLTHNQDRDERDKETNAFHTCETSQDEIKHICLLMIL